MAGKQARKHANPPTDVSMGLFSFILVAVTDPARRRRGRQSKTAVHGCQSVVTHDRGGLTQWENGKVVRTRWGIAVWFCRGRWKGSLGDVRFNPAER